MSTKPNTWGIHWFRRDLRVHGNAALIENHRRTGGRTLGLFCFDSKFLSRDDFSHNRFAFFLNTLAALKEDLLKLGGDLVVVDCLPHDAFPKLIADARSSTMDAPTLVTFGRDYEPFARKRDATIEKLLVSEGIECATFRDHLLFEPHEILKDDGSFYRVYSPFARKWFERLSQAEGKQRLTENSTPFKKHFALKWADLPFRSFADALSEFTRENERHVKIKIPKAGHRAGLARLDEFARDINQYGSRRDFPAADATSYISLFQKNGSLTLPQIFARLKLDGKRSAGQQKFAQELVWREFFYNVLYHRPQVEGAPFNAKYENLAWFGTDADFKRWCEGSTGVPIVDAGMRQLASEGWMTNRMRIITASFLIKDLGVDWRKGELHFMHRLIDGDTANNNGNWQWVASTGAEAQPFFRVLNPWTQGERFDPEGTYIRKYVPELKGAPTKALHDAKADRSEFRYPEPMVNHAERRPRAIAMYKK